MRLKEDSFLAAFPLDSRIRTRCTRPIRPHKKVRPFSVALYINFSLLTMVTCNHLHRLHTCRGVWCSPSPVQLVMTDPGAFLQIKQPLLLLPSALLFLQCTLRNTHKCSPAGCDEGAEKDLCGAHSLPLQVEEEHAEVHTTPRGRQHSARTGTGLNTRSAPCKLSLCFAREGTDTVDAKL